MKWGARVLRVRSVPREEAWASAGVQEPNANREKGSRNSQLVLGAAYRRELTRPECRFLKLRSGGRLDFSQSAIWPYFSLSRTQIEL